MTQSAKTDLLIALHKSYAECPTGLGFGHAIAVLLRNADPQARTAYEGAAAEMIIKIDLRPSGRNFDELKRHQDDFKHLTQGFLRAGLPLHRIVSPAQAAHLGCAQSTLAKAFSASASHMRAVMDPGALQEEADQHVQSLLSETHQRSTWQRDQFQQQAAHIRPDFLATYPHVTGGYSESYMQGIRNGTSKWFQRMGEAGEETIDAVVQSLRTQPPGNYSHLFATTIETSAQDAKNDRKAAREQELAAFRAKNQVIAALSA